MTDYTVSTYIKNLCNRVTKTNELLERIAIALENKNNINNYTTIQHTHIKPDEIIGPGLPPQGPYC